MNAPYQAFQTADGWITVGASNQANWERFLKLIDAEELATDERFVTNELRMRNRLVLEEELTRFLVVKTSEDWLDLFEQGGFPAGPVLNVKQMHEDPQTLAREMVVEVEHSRLGSTKTLGLPVKFSITPGAVKQGAPTLGENTEEVLREFGIADHLSQAILKKTRNKETG